jgi:hypothetical protein
MMNMDMSWHRDICKFLKFLTSLSTCFASDLVAAAVAVAAAAAAWQTVEMDETKASIIRSARKFVDMMVWRRAKID